MAIQPVNMSRGSNINFKGMLDLQENYYRAWDFYDEHENQINTIGAVALSAIVIGGLIYRGALFPSIKANAVAKKALGMAPDVSKTARESIEKAKSLLKETTEIIKGDKTSNHVTITTKDGIVHFLKIEDDNGVLQREAKFCKLNNAPNKYEIDTITEYRQDGLKNLYTFNSPLLMINKETIRIEEGVNLSNSGIKTTVEKDIRLGRDDNKMTIFRNSVITNEQGKAQDYLVFNSNNNLIDYVKNPRIDSTKKRHFAAKVELNDNKVNYAKLRSGRTVLEANENGILERVK